MAYEEESRRQFIVDPAHVRRSSFGLHPRFHKTFARAMRDGRRLPVEKWEARYQQPIAAYRDPRHPFVCVLPRSAFCQYVDDCGDCIGGTQSLWFSSTDFYVDMSDKPGAVFAQFHHPLFERLWSVSELQFLVPPYPTDKEDGELVFITPPFSHSRGEHCLLAAAIAEVLLARAGFSTEERAAFVLAMGYHDIAMPAGGDSVKRVSPDELDEEKNFASLLEQTGLAAAWKQQFGFSLDAAAAWVRNEGMLGLLLDIIDKISYVSMDCYSHGLLFNGNVRKHCSRHPLFLDVWRDIRFTPDRQRFAFLYPDRLFDFLLARAYEYQELLFNPAARFLDFHLTNLVRPLYETGRITKDQLLSWSDGQLECCLEAHYGEAAVHLSVINAANYQWQRFDTQEELIDFWGTLGKSFDHVETISGFNPNLEWPVYAANGTDIVPARERLTPAQISELETIVKATRGNFIYWHT
ncbi:MAG: hypothetical protein PHY34_00545 [Patescibacteria group bacterium]|nr:hypothetical protein [Patescibacteria group bacterium]MDD5715882.1 hypothetical protein [Patescibacteria group bacterium]